MWLLHAGLQVVYAHLLRLWAWYLCLLSLLVVCLYPLCVIFISTPSVFPVGEIVYIPAGSSVTQAGKILTEHHIIYTPVAFRIALVSVGEARVQSGSYYFGKRETVWRVAYRVYSGSTENSGLRVTFPEGSTRYDMAQLLVKKIPDFDATRFITLTQDDEGYLFPDTYNVSVDQPLESTIQMLKDNYRAHTGWYDSGSAKILSESDAVILASILEGEANTPEDRELVAGILLKRLALGMRLQVDAPFGYERRVRGYVPTRNDIETKTPYNTYRNKGLPPTPINNPGYEALYAATHPKTSPYLYYLTGSDGRMHYAKTFEEHVRNQKVYFK